MPLTIVMRRWLNLAAGWDKKVCITLIYVKCEAILNFPYPLDCYCKWA
jgi:hypothetical protein